MRASFWVGLVFAFFLFLLGGGWYREREHARRAILDKEQIALKLEELLQSQASSDQSNVDLPEVNPEAIGTSKRSDSTSIVPPSSSAIEATTAVLSPPNIQGEKVIDLEDTRLSSDTGLYNFATNEPPLYTDLQLETYRCLNQLIEINIAAERWAADHNGLIPPNLTELRGYLAPMILICPGARPHSLSAAWGQFKPEDITYLVSPSSSGRQWDFQIQGQASPVTVIWLRCLIHKKLSTDNRIRFGGIPVSQEFRPR
jgi:hypothetical protein